MLTVQISSDEDPYNTQHTHTHTQKGVVLNSVGEYYAMITNFGSRYSSVNWMMMVPVPELSLLVVLILLRRHNWVSPGTVQ